MFDPDRRHLIAYLAAAAVLVVIAVRYVDRASGSGAAPSISMPAPAQRQAARTRARSRPAPKQRIWVDIAGAVRRPGLYSLPPDARVAAGIERAGGFARGANRAGVNLAAKLVDAQQVFVPPHSPDGQTPAATSPAPSASVPSVAGSGSSVGGAAPAAAISLSTASESELEQLDGVGPALAQRIIEYRQQHDGFHSIDELQEVSGIGPKRFAALKDSIVP